MSNGGAPSDKGENEDDAWVSDKFALETGAFKRSTGILFPSCGLDLGTILTNLA